MNTLHKHISQQTVNFLQEKFQIYNDLISLNQEFEKICGIVDFFENDTDLIDFKKKYKALNDRKEKSEYGDYQTNSKLSDKVCELLKTKKISPEIIFEPTFGKGNFIISALRSFNNIKQIYGVEIYKPYIQITKLKILDFFIINPNIRKPTIKLYHANFFDFDIKKQIKIQKNKDLLIIGNPPWATNSELSGIGSENLPIKVNFKNHKGLDAMTGKGNFDIAEFISNTLFDNFSENSGDFAFLVKNSVIKNILHRQTVNNYKITNLRKYKIDAKKEFNVSVNASLFYCKLNSKSDRLCNEYDFYSKDKIKTFGWLNDKFVSNTKTYSKYQDFDGTCQYEWRQGMKHDASKIMELDKENDLYVNKFNDKIELEDDLVYGILKSSDLKGGTINKTRKYTIVTQKKIGQDTKYIKNQHPKTYNYLQSKIELFNNRKSSIYKGKPAFSIFGIGDYSFKPYKIAISGLYKKLNFTLIEPDKNNKPIMLDDTCYFIGFDDKIEAETIFEIVKSENIREFLSSLIFSDAKRSVTKDLLMRIDIATIMQEFKKTNLNNDSYLKISKKIKPIVQTKLALFG
ncbi:MAG: hypothetical protein U9Q83_12165 [Bacteroidota bacterium]|nr:hypothetical protein [Bacteroidota bacterium]